MKIVKWLRKWVILRPFKPLKKFILNLKQNYPYIKTVEVHIDESAYAALCDHLHGVRVLTLAWEVEDVHVAIRPLKSQTRR